MWNTYWWTYVDDWVHSKFRYFSSFFYLFFAMGLSMPFLCIHNPQQISDVWKSWMSQVVLMDSHRLTRDMWKDLIFLYFSSMLGSPMTRSGNDLVHLWLPCFPELCDKLHSSLWICGAVQGHLWHRLREPWFLCTFPSRYTLTHSQLQVDNNCCGLKWLSSMATIVKEVPVYHLSCKKPWNCANKLDFYSYNWRPRDLSD